MSADIGSAESFLLERFTWASPDRLELDGRFAHLGDPPGDAPVLILRGAHRVHRLPAVAERCSGVPREGEPWHAEFAWAEPPEPFDGAELELGTVAVVLPEPSATGSGEPQPLPVRRPEPRDGARRSGLDADLVSAIEQVRATAEAAVANEHAEVERLTQERDALRTRVDELEQEVRAAEAALAHMGKVRENAETAITEVEQLLGRMQTLRDALDRPG